MGTASGWCGSLRAVAVGAVLLASAACGGSSGGGSAARASTAPAASTARELSMVVVGDSIPFNSPDDCPGCTGFVEQYAEAVESATGADVTVQNLSQHTGLTLPELVAGLDALRGPLAAADVIVVAIAHNSFPLNSDTPCGQPLLDDAPDWRAVDAGCADRTTSEFAPGFDELYSRIAGWREGKPTVLRTINRYDDWAGADGLTLTKDEASSITMLHDAWNTMLCTAAEAHGFSCADVYHAFNGADGTVPSGDLLGDDDTHPSQQGNDEIARVLTAQGFSPLV